jgi:A/G-specific adenine glycosylase
VVDGNVERVLGRVTGVTHTREDVWQLADEVLSPRRPGDFNEAMMELGATVCTPKDPRCGTCPISRWCCTKGVLKGSKQKARLRREASYVLSARDGEVYLVKRAASASLMPGMWELPQVEGDEGEPIRMSLKHSITTTDYTVRVAQREAAGVARGQWVPFRQVARLPLTGLARKILKRAEII